MMRVSSQPAGQAKGTPARTQAPEILLSKGIELLDTLAVEKLGFRLFREHAELKQILLRTHRYRAIDAAGLFSLAKDLARLTADSIDGSAVLKAVTSLKGEKRSSLKALESLIATKIGADDARTMMGPLFGIYELRHADAHLPSSDVREAFELAGVVAESPFVIQGYQLLHACALALHEIAKVLQSFEAPHVTAPGRQ